MKQTMFLAVLLSIASLSLISCDGEPEQAAPIQSLYGASTIPASQAIDALEVLDTITNSETITSPVATFYTPSRVDVQINKKKLSGTASSITYLEHATSLTDSNWRIVAIDTSGDASSYVLLTATILRGRLRVRNVSTGTQSVEYDIDAAASPLTSISPQ